MSGTRLNIVGGQRTCSVTQSSAITHRSAAVRSRLYVTWPRFLTATSQGPDRAVMAVACRQLTPRHLDAYEP